MKPGLAAHHALISLGGALQGIDLTHGADPGQHAESHGILRIDGRPGVPPRDDQAPHDKLHISTSYAERQNLTMRMSMRRFTRLTNAFSKKVENLAHAVSLHFMYYNFGRIHKSLRLTPAMEAGISDHVWSLGEIAALVG
jgi:hypothetical protein